MRYGIRYARTEEVTNSERKAAHQRALWIDRESTVAAKEREEGVRVLEVVGSSLSLAVEERAPTIMSIQVAIEACTRAPASGMRRSSTMERN